MFLLDISFLTVMSKCLNVKGELTSVRIECYPDSPVTEKFPLVLTLEFSNCYIDAHGTFVHEITFTTRSR